MEITVLGTLRPDGSLILDHKPNFPPGRVQVKLVPEPSGERTGEDVWAVLDRIRAERGTRGATARTREEIDADIEAMRNEWDNSPGDGKP